VFIVFFELKRLNPTNPTNPKKATNPTNPMNTTNSTNSTNRPGFTLLEVLIAVFILAVVLSTIFTSYSGTFRVVNETESQAEMYEMARVAMQRIIEDLESLCFPRSEKSEKSESEKTSEIEEEPVQRARFLGEDKEINGRAADTLRFLSRAHLVLDEDGEASGPAEIMYSVKESAEGDTLVLYRADTLEFEKVSEEEEEGVILCDSLVSVNFTYTDAKGDVHDTWDSTKEEFKERLPVKVSILLEFVNKSRPEAPLKFMTGVAVPMAREDNAKSS